MSTGQSPETKTAQEGLMPIEGTYCDGEFALYEQNGVKAEACLGTDKKIAHVAVRGLSENYSFDMINAHTKRVDASVKTPAIMAQEALATAVIYDKTNRPNSK